MKRYESRTSQVQIDLKSRRMFLKSASGFTLSLPFLSSLLTAQSEVAMAAVNPPLRYIQLFSPLGGLLGSNWVGPNSASTPFELYPGHTAYMSPLASLASVNGVSPVFDAGFGSLLPHMNLILGLDSTVGWQHNRGVGIGAFLTNKPGSANLSDQLRMNGKIDIEFPSVDQVLGYANQSGVYHGTLSGRRRFFNFGSPSWGRDDYTDLASPVVSRDALGRNLSGAFSYLFGFVARGAAQGSNNPLLNLVNEFWPSGRSLLRVLSGEDRRSLDNLFQLAQQAANQYSGPMPACSDTTRPTSVDSAWTGSAANFNALADLIVMALKCDVTRVVTVGSGENPFQSVWHALSHVTLKDDGPTSFANAQNELVKIHKNIADNFFRYLGDKLRTTPDATATGSSLLDNSLLHWTQENRVAHSTNCLPTVLLGGAGGRINTGNLIDLRDRTRSGEVDGSGFAIHPGEIINRLWANIFYAMDIPRSAYEVSRGGGSDAVALSKGYGHVLINKVPFFKTHAYNLSQIGEPWDFLRKPGTPWG